MISGSLVTLVTPLLLMPSLSEVWLDPRPLTPDIPVSSLGKKLLLILSLAASWVGFKMESLVENLGLEVGSKTGVGVGAVLGFWD